jgi:hypothetical protein
MIYRFVVLSSSGDAARAEDWSCASDEEAIERAAHAVPSYGAELWRGDRRVSVFAGPLNAMRPEAQGTRHEPQTP